MSKSKLSGSASRANTRCRMGKEQHTAVEETDDADPEVPQLSWKVLSEEAVSELSSLSVEGVASKLAKLLCLHQHEELLQEAAELDYFVAGYWFCREQKFSEEQTSAFFTLLRDLMDKLKVQQMSLAQNVRELQKMMVGVGVSDETALKCFTKDHALMAIQYVTSSLFQHYRLFQLLFTEEQEEEHIITKLSMCLPPTVADLSPPPLEEAVSLDFYQRCIEPTPLDDQQEVHHTGVEVTEEGEGTGDISSLAVSADDVKAVMETVVKGTLSSYQTQVSQKLKDKEDSVLKRISRLEENFAQ